MFSSRFIRMALALAITVAALAITSTAYASGGSYLPTTADGRSADTRDAARNAQQASTVPSDGRSADTRDAVYSAQQAAPTPSDGRSPDTLDAASSPQPVAFTQPGGFDWSDAGVGAGFTGGLVVLLGAVAMLRLRHQSRRHIRTT